MNREIREGRWMQVRGRAKRAWARVTGDSQLAADGNADVVAGALEESVGLAKRDAEKKVRHTVDRLAAAAKRLARRLGR